MRFTISTCVVLLSILSGAHAGVVKRSGDWALEDNSSRTDPHGPCIAVTEFEDERVTWRLEISHLKGKLAPTEVLIKQNGRSAGGWHATLDNGFILAFAKSIKESRNDIFIGVPQKTSALISQLEYRRDVVMKPADKTRNPRLSFSADGFTKIKQEFQKRCLDNAELSQPAFENLFVKQNGTLNPMNISVESIQELRKLYRDAYAIHLKFSTNAGELSALKLKFKAELDEALSLKTTIALLSGTQIPKAKQLIVENDRNEVDGRRILAESIAAIPGLEVKVVADEKVYKKAEAVIAPFEREHSNRASSASEARSSVNQAKARLAEIDSQLASHNSTLNSLRQELRNLQAATSNLSYRASETRRVYEQAQREFSSFHPQNEFRNILQRDYTYQNYLREVPQLEREARALEKGVTDARARRDNKERDLSTCRMTAGADCSNQEQTLKRANDLLAQIKDEERGISSKLSVLHSQINSIENRANQEVQSRLSQLERKLNSAVNELNQAENLARINQDRINSLSQSEIPNVSQRISSLEYEKPGIQSQINRMGPEAQRLERELAAYEERVGWDAMERSLNQASNTLYRSQTLLSGTRRTKVQMEAQIQTSLTQRPLLAQDLAQKELKLTENLTRESQVLEALKPFEAESARIQSEGSTMRGDFEGLSQQFVNLLPLS